MWSEVWDEARQLMTNPKMLLYFVVPSILLNLLSVLIRAWRWQSMLGTPWIPVRPLFYYLSIGFMCNNTLPARAGEFVRSFLVSKRHSHKFTTVFATVIVERVFDFAIVILIFGIIILLVPFPEMVLNEEGELVPSLVNALKGAGVVSLFVVLGVTVVLMGLVYAPDFFLRVIQFFLKPLPQTLRQKIEELQVKFTLGLSTFRRPLSALWSVALSFLIWFVIGYSYHLMVMAFQLHGVPLAGSLVIMVAVCMAVSIPQGPGYLGPYQWVCVEVMTKIYGVMQAKAVAFSIVVWTTQIFPIAIMGLICLGIVGLRFRDVASATGNTEEKI